MSDAWGLRYWTQDIWRFGRVGTEELRKTQPLNDEVLAQVKGLFCIVFNPQRSHTSHIELSMEAKNLRH